MMLLGGVGRECGGYGGRDECEGGLWKKEVIKEAWARGLGGGGSGGGIEYIKINAIYLLFMHDWKEHLYSIYSKSTWIVFEYIHGSWGAMIEAKMVATRRQSRTLTPWRGCRHPTWAYIAITASIAASWSLLKLAIGGRGVYLGARHRIVTHLSGYLEVWIHLNVFNKYLLNLRRVFIFNLFALLVNRI